ncbi:Dynein heavy chain, cytoplasmic [Talaromyces islandicus]|uniref:Dynein heavy chain, cytoplasmic n=1 Tax=Talaromyces islandicus TaxID=28573 RepID=A0A0U1LX20_TALIS|nr:Dynein heavy chain, cytoplasmic [Talaromyces islandicus]
MWIISFWLLPVISALVWLAMLIAMISTWAAQGKPRYREMSASEHVPYISDIGATGLKPLFIAMGTVTVVTLDLAFLSERWLRHRGQLVRNKGRFDKICSIISLFFAVAGAAGLILLTIFDTVRHPSMHRAFLGLFIGGYLLSAIFICLEYLRLGIFYRRKHVVLIVSFWIKLIFVVTELGLAIAFGVLDKVSNRQNAAAIVEWVISLIFTFYVLSFVIDLLPSVRSRHRIPQAEKGLQMGSVRPSASSGALPPDDRFFEQPVTTDSMGFVLGSADRPFDNILNFRDVGRSINGFNGDKILREGVLFRSARPDDASERDTQRLTDEIGLATIIDLRSSTEHALAAQRRRDARILENPDTANPENVSVAAPADQEHLLNLPNVTRRMISMTGRAFERMLLWRLDWYNFIKALGLAASGYRTDAARLVATNVMKPRGLIGLAQDMLDCGGAEIREIFGILAAKIETTTYPLVIHCTQGKDRTGLIILLLLLFLAVPLDTISADYMKSEAELEPELEYLMKEITQIGLDEDYAKCPPGFAEAVRGYLDSKYGGVEAYLVSIGVGQDEMDTIRQRLLMEER